jgi:hypothetical protein
LGLSLLLLLTACTPPPVVDLPASDLDVKLAVIDTDASPSDSRVPIVVQFFSAGRFVELAGNATVTCNGVTMSWNGLGYAARVPIVAVGGMYQCSHVRNGVTTTASVTVPARPVFVSPTQNATVARSTSLTITYVPGSGTGVRASAGDGTIGRGGNVQPDNGTYTGFDVSSLNAGPGSIGLTRELTIVASGTGFSSAEFEYSSGSDINVTWT